MSVHVHHPETGADLVVTEGQLDHMRASGWVLRSEHDETVAAQQAAAETAAATPPGKSDGGK